MYVNMTHIYRADSFCYYSRNWAKEILFSDIFSSTRPKLETQKKIETWNAQKSYPTLLCWAMNRFIEGRISIIFH